MKRALTVVGMIVFLCSARPTHGGQSTPTLSKQTLQLIEQWIEEAQKYLDSPPLDRSRKTATLVDLLDRGNRVMRLALRESNGEQGPGEAFGEVNDKISEELWKNGDRNDQRVLDVLVRGAYNNDSPFAVEIARGYGERIAPTLLEIAGSDLSIDRATATGMLGTLLQYSNLEPTTRDSVHNGIIKAASDEKPGVRIDAVIALRKVGTPVDLTILQQIAVNDPVRDGVRYPVREAAQRAIVAIQKR